MFTAEHGKLRAVAKGARRSSSKLVGHLEPLTLVRLSLAHGRELEIITQAQVTDGLPALKEDLASVARGLYVAELLDGFGPEDSPHINSNGGLFRLAAGVLRELPKRKTRKPRCATRVPPAAAHWNTPRTVPVRGVRLGDCARRPPLQR